MSASTMLLAAGRGERMRPLTDRLPKPLLPAGGKPLAAWHLEKLAAAGFSDVVINLAHLGDLIEQSFGDGARFGLRIHYSRENEALETAGGIALALPMLGADPFLAVNADIVTDFDFGSARGMLDDLAADARRLAHLILVDNPVHHPDGDFTLRDGRIGNALAGRLTFAGIGVYKPALFAGLSPGVRAPLAPLLRAGAERGQISGQHFRGLWLDVGTQERLAQADAILSGMTATTCVRQR